MVASKRKLFVGLFMVLLTVRLSMAEVTSFNTAEVAGFENLIFKIDAMGWSKTHSEWEILRFLRHNRSLSGDFVRVNEDGNSGEIGAEIDLGFMVDHVRSRLAIIKDTEDIFDPIGSPGEGYEYDLHIVHPGSRPGVLEGANHPIIIICQGFTGGMLGNENAYDWLSDYFAEQGYIIAMPRFFENFFIDPRTGESNNVDILKFMLLMSDVASLQVSDTIDYLIEHFGNKVNRKKVTVIGHSNGGFVSLLAATKDRRIARIAFISSVLKLYGTWDGKQLAGNFTNVLDSYDAFRYLNRTRVRWGEGPSLHVQRGIASDEGCPPGIPCDILVDMMPLQSPYDLSNDPWISFEGCSGPCVDKTLTYYNWAIYEGPKEEEVKDNPFTDHGFGGDRGREEALRLLDDFFSNSPVN